MFIIPVRYSSAARDGRASTTLSHQRRGEKKDSSPCAITRAFGVLVDVWMCACVRICLHVCMSYLWVHLRHWAAGYAALKGCVSAATPLSPAPCVFLLAFGLLCFVCVSGSFTIAVLFVCIPLSMCYHNCFQRTMQKGLEESVSFTAFHIQRRRWTYAIWEWSWLALVVLRT